MTLSEFDRVKIAAIMGGHGDWFTAQLLRLVAKADDHHKAQLRMAFPEEVALVEAWQRGEISMDV
jgi:hypothetical protein